MMMSFILGARCNARCGHCAKAYGPTRPEELSPRLILRLMDEAAQIDDGEPLAFAITGGEPFVQFEALLEVVAHGAALGARVHCVTNAYWATTAETATGKLSALRSRGLWGLSVSVSRFHQQFVPLRRVRTALQAAAALGISTTLKGAVVNADLEPGGELAGWKEQLDADDIRIFPVLPYLRPGEALPEQAYYREPGLPQEPCPEEILTVDFNGAARSCCSPGHADEFLTVGDAATTPLAQIERRFRLAGRQRILREQGPIAFARAAIAAGLGERLRPAYAGPCDLCLHIRADDELRHIAEQLSAAADSMIPDNHSS